MVAFLSLRERMLSIENDTGDELLSQSLRDSSLGVDREDVTVDVGDDVTRLAL